MTNISNYFEDGVNYQAQAVLLFVKRNSDIEESYNKERNVYEAQIKVARWENCREQGYILSLKTKDYSKQLNIAFFEHRNSDSIHAVKWEQTSLNSITIDNAKFGNIYKDKYDTSFSVGYGEIKEMSEWIISEFKQFYIENK